MAINSQNKERTIIECPFCESKLRVPINQEGNINCPQCKKDFMTNTYNQPKQYDVVIGGQNSQTTHTVHPSSEKAIFSSKILSQSDPIYAEEITASPQRNTQWVNSPEMDLDIRILKKKIIAYQIQWFNGGWSGWYVPGVNDLYQKAREPLRRVWAHFNDHHHRYLCIPLDYQTQIRKFNELDQGLVPSEPSNSGVKLFEGAANPNPQWMTKSGLNGDIALTGHKIIAYKIQKIDGNWSGWIVPGYQDIDQASDQRRHRWWAYFQECRHQYLYMEVLDRNLYQDILEESDQSRSDDVVIKEKSSGLVGAVVLGGIDALKQRFKSHDESVRLQTLTEALNYKSQGLDFLKQALNDESEEIQKVADDLLTAVQIHQILLGPNFWLFFEYLHRLGDAGKTHDTHTIAITPDGKTLISCSQKNLKIRGLWRDNWVRTLEADVCLSSMVLSPDGQTLVNGDESGNLHIWNLQTLTLLRTLEGHSGWVWCVAISPDNQILVSGSADKTVKTWDLKTGTLLRTLEGHSSDITDLAISPDGQTLVSVSRDQTVKIWDLKTGTRLQTLETVKEKDANYIWCVAISSDGQTVVSGGQNGTLDIWNLKTGTLLRTLEKHPNEIMNVAISPEGQTVISGSWDNTLKIWDLNTGMLQRTLKDHSSLAFYAHLWRYKCIVHHKTLQYYVRIKNKDN